MNSYVPAPSVGKKLALAADVPVCQGFQADHFVVPAFSKLDWTSKT